MPAARTCRRLLPALVLAATLGCAAGPAPRDHFYRLEAATPDALASPALRGTLEVDRLRVEAISQGQRMLYRDTSRSEQIGQHAYYYWVDPPGVMLQDQLVRYLRSAGVAENVVTPAVHVESDYLVSGRIIRMERILSGKEQRVAIEVELALTRQEERDLLLLKTYSEERAAGGVGVDESVAAFDAAITAIFEQFVADIPRS